MSRRGLRPPASSKFQKKKNLGKAGRLLIYNKLDKAIQSHLDEARKAEWNNYVKFDAVKILTRKEAEKLIDAGTEVLPTSWVDVDKNSGLTETVREHGKTITRPAEPKYKSRLVARGDAPGSSSTSIAPQRRAATQISTRYGIDDCGGAGSGPPAGAFPRSLLEVLFG